MTIEFSDGSKLPPVNLAGEDVHDGAWFKQIASRSEGKSDVTGYMMRQLRERMKMDKNTAAEYEAYAKAHHVDAGNNIDMAMFVAWITDTPIVRAAEFQLWRTGENQRRTCIEAIRRFYYLHGLEVTPYKTIREPLKLIRSFPVSFSINKERIASEYLLWLKEHSWLIVRDKHGMSGLVR